MKVDDMGYIEDLTFEEALLVLTHALTPVHVARGNGKSILSTNLNISLHRMTQEVYDLRKENEVLRTLLGRKNESK